MSQWGNIDRANNSPIWGPSTVNKTANTANRDALYNNTTPDAFVTGLQTGVFGVTPDEMSDTLGGVANVVVLTAGSGFTVRPTVTFAPGTTNATATATAKAVSATIAAPGTGFANGDVVRITTTGAAGAAANSTFNVVTNGTGNVTAVTVNAAGSYTTLPTAIANNATTNVTGTGTGLRLDLSFGVNDVTVTANGTGYVSAPDVTFGGTGGTGATARAVLRTAQGSTHAAGWVLRKVLPNGRVQTETLVAMKSLTSDGSDDTVFPES